MLDLIVIVPHVLTVLVVVCWLFYGRRFNAPYSTVGRDGPGGKRTRPTVPRLPLIGGDGRRRDLARSA
jgi:hypothetical protein